MAHKYRWDNFVLDLDTYRLERAGARLDLEPKAFNLLTLLVSRPHHLFTKQEIFETVWPDTTVTDHALTRVVAQIRRVLGDDARETRYLETVPTRGYRWICPVSVDNTESPSADAGPTDPPTTEPALNTVHERTSVQRPVWILGAILVVVVVGLVVAAWRQPAAPSAAGNNWEGPARERFPTQVTTHPGLDLQPVFSPGADAIAFASDRTGGFEIFVRALTTGASDVPITRDGQQNLQPAWSPDGQSIAYHSSTRGGIWIVPARGGTSRQVAPRGSNPEWSPDGRLIAFQSDEQADVAPNGFGAQLGSVIMLVGADGSGLRPLTRRGQPMGGHGLPAWSRGGTWIAFSVFDGGREDGLWVASATTGVVEPLNRDVRAYEAVFTADDAAIYAAGGEAVILRLPFDPATGKPAGTPEPIVVPGVPGVRGLSLSPDGTRLAFAGLALTSHIWNQPLGRDALASGPPTPLTNDTSRRNYVPAISPDGSRIAYMSARRGEAQNLWMIDLANGTPVQLTDDPGSERLPSWLPDGRHVAYVSESETRSAVLTIDVETRRTELLIDTQRAPPLGSGSVPIGGRLTELQLSPSARLAAFAMASPPEGNRRLYVATLAPLSARTLTDGRVSIGYPVWSPDERRLAVEIQDDGDTHLGVLDVATGDLRQITRERGQIWARSWSPDGTRVTAAVMHDRRWSLEWFEPDTGRRGILTPPAASRVYYRYPEWSPRGDRIVFERGEMLGNIWMLRIAPAR